MFKARGSFGGPWPSRGFPEPCKHLPAPRPEIRLPYIAAILRMQDADFAAAFDCRPLCIYAFRNRAGTAFIVLPAFVFSVTLRVGERMHDIENVAAGISVSVLELECAGRLAFGQAQLS